MGDLLAEVEELNGTAPPLIDSEESDCQETQTEGSVTRYQAAMMKVLQWGPTSVSPMPDKEDFRLAVRGICQCRKNGHNKGCFEWVGDRMGLNRQTIRRVKDGETPLSATHILCLQAIIFSDWVRTEGFEPRDIFSDKTDTALARTLREKVKGYVPPEEQTPALDLADMEQLWEAMCQSIVEHGDEWSEEQFADSTKRLRILSNNIKAKYIIEEKGPKGKYYVDHANDIAVEVSAIRRALGNG